MNKNNIRFNRKTLPFLIIISCILLSSCKEKNSVEILPTDPLFKNSIVSTDIDFITSEDSNTFLSLQYLGQMEQEMPDKRNEILMDDKTFVFEASFTDGSIVEIWAHSSFDKFSEAEKYAQMLTGPLGKLPEIMRSRLLHVVIHKGDETAFGESEGHFFVLYSDNMETRISNHDLEETVFHESVHATLESTYKNNETWLKAQEDDGNFITEYAANNPDKEDLPETAIFAYTILKYPGRLPADVEKWINDYIPNRLAFFRTVFTIDIAPQ